MIAVFGAGRGICCDAAGIIVGEGGDNARPHYGQKQRNPFPDTFCSHAGHPPSPYGNKKSPPAQCAWEGVFRDKFHDKNRFYGAKKVCQKVKTVFCFGNRKKAKRR